MSFRRRPSPLSLGLLAAAACLCAGVSHAGHLYRFQDDAGNTLLTNLVDRNVHPSGSDKQRYTHLVKVVWYADTNVHRYRNWGRNEAAVQPSFSRNRNAYDDLIRTAANRWQLDFGLVKAVIHTESGFNPYARSNPGAQGLMQLMPATANRYRVANVWDPAQNIEAGSHHLRYLLDRYHDLNLALAAYNAGERNVDRYNGIPPFPETQDYVQRVTGRYNHLYSDRGNDNAYGTVNEGAPLVN